jgi:hypothetical protein
MSAEEKAGFGRAARLEFERIDREFHERLKRVLGSLT